MQEAGLGGLVHLWPRWMFALLGLVGDKGLEASEAGCICLRPGASDLAVLGSSSQTSRLQAPDPEFWVPGCLLWAQSHSRPAHECVHSPSRQLSSGLVTALGDAAHLGPPDSPPHPESFCPCPASPLSPSLSPRELEQAGAGRGRGGSQAGSPGQ